MAKDEGGITSLNVTMQEIYSKLCEECKKKTRTKKERNKRKG